MTNPDKMSTLLVLCAALAVSPVAPTPLNGCWLTAPLNSTLKSNNFFGTYRDFKLYRHSNFPACSLNADHKIFWVLEALDDTSLDTHLKGLPSAEVSVLATVGGSAVVASTGKISSSNGIYINGSL